MCAGTGCAMLVAYSIYYDAIFGRLQVLSTCAVVFLPDLRCVYDLGGRVI
jgi:hypothetical protein